MGPLKGHERLETGIMVGVVMSNENPVYRADPVAHLGELEGHPCPRIDEIGSPIDD
jgi:hypothetical protein